MPQITPPKYVRQILFGLQARGHLAYLVGGCVRDVIMGITPQDWDICTSALPEEVMELFPGSRPTGIEHGTVTVIIDLRLQHTVQSFCIFTQIRVFIQNKNKWLFFRCPK